MTSLAQNQNYPWGNKNGYFYTTWGLSDKTSTHIWYKQQSYYIGKIIPCPFYRGDWAKQLTPNLYTGFIS